MLLNQVSVDTGPLYKQKGDGESLGSNPPMDSEALWIWNKDLQDLGRIYKVPGSSVQVSKPSQCGIHLPPGLQAEHAGQVRQLWALLGGGSSGQDHSVPKAKYTQTVPCGVLARDADTDLWNVTCDTSWYSEQPATGHRLCSKKESDEWIMQRLIFPNE